MDAQQSKDLERKLRQQWQQVRIHILQRFAQVSMADIDAAYTPDDLVRRVADKTQFSPGYVETQIRELVGAGVGGGGGTQSRSSRRRGRRGSGKQQAQSPSGPAAQTQQPFGSSSYSGG